jgi:hypothetical protein
MIPPLHTIPPRPAQAYFPAPTQTYNNRFGVIFFMTTAAFLGAGLYLKTVPPIQTRIDEKKASAITTQFLVSEKKPAPPPKVTPKINKKEVFDLTKSPLLKQKEDVAAPGQNAPPQTDHPAARPVYGLRRVYSVGLGAGGAASSAVIGKIGNTLSKDIDTVTPSKQDLAGPLVAISTVTSAPRLKAEVKPEYTKEMIEAKVQGLIRAELLVGADGKVKEIKIQNDLGFGTRQAAHDLFLKLQFEPAMRDGTPVAVWITFSIRYVLLQE